MGISSDSESRITPESLPSGTVTFAFTDIEGSTSRWERDRIAMQEAVRRHDTLVRAALTANGGYVFKTTGDGFCTAFRRPEDAVAAMLAAQRGLASEDFSHVDGIRVRAAIHTGTADEREGDYFGPAVNRVARLLAIAHGGQVLVSGLSTGVVEGALPATVGLRDLGAHRLKDLTRPERVYQLLAPDLQADFPPLRSLEMRPNNLPAVLTSFIGRETEIAHITALLSAHRLVTVVGAGGIGKTRTSLQVAANSIDAFSDGVWFIELASLAHGDYIPSTVAQALGIALAPEGDPLERLVRALTSKRALIVFDNCEHLVAATARVIAALLRGASKLTILASSRQALAISGEETYRLPSLAVPVENDGRALRADVARQSPAIALFVERARAVEKRFSLSDENAAAVIEIAQRLDGIPLAIELAAARIKMLSARQLCARLSERFQVLTGGSRDVLPRQQTLRALIDWSYDLLDERERRLFRRLSVFVKGFALEGAVALGAAESVADFEIFDLLASLVDKSLVLAEPAGELVRYRLLESTRVYAGEKLEAAGEGDECRARHLRHLHDSFLIAEERFEQTARWADADEMLATELEDARAALDYALGGPYAALGSEMMAASRRAWRTLGIDGEGLARSEAFLACLPKDDARLIARLSSAIAWIAGNAGRAARAYEAATEAIGYARRAGDPFVLADALIEFAANAGRLGRFDEATVALAEAATIPGLPKSPRLSLLQKNAYLSGIRGDLDTAGRLFESLRFEHRNAGNAGAERTMAMNLAEVEHKRGHTQKAIEVLRELLPGFRADGDRNLSVLLLTNLAGYLVAIDAVTEACATARQVIRELARTEPESAYVPIALEHLALALALRGDYARSVTLGSYAEAAMQKLGFARELTEKSTHERLTALQTQVLGPADLATLHERGAALASEAAISLALEEP